MSQIHCLLRHFVASLLVATSLVALSHAVAAQVASPAPASTATASPATAPPTIAPPAIAPLGPAINGVVSSERGPLAGVTVTIHGPATQSVTTQADGAFHFTNIPAGTYRLTATAPGYQPLPNTVVTMAADSPQTVAVTLEAATLSSLRTIASTSTVGRGSTAVNTTGAALETVTAQEYIDRGDFQVQDILEEYPGVELTRASSGGAPGANTDVGIRGAAPYETQTLIDGHPVTGGSYGEFLIQFLNPLVLSGIEVDAGPGVMGNTIQNAVGGTVNFRTPPITTNLQGRFTTGYDSYNGSTYSARVSDTIGKFGFLAAYGFYGTPGYFTGDLLSVSASSGAQAGVIPTATVNQAIPASETFQNRSQVFKVAYNFSPTTALTLGEIAEQTYVDYTATLDTVEPVKIVGACSACGTYNNPAFGNLVGQTVLGSTQYDNLYLGNYELDNEPILTADLRTAIGPGNLLARFYTGSINRQIDDPQESNQITAWTKNAAGALVPTLDTPYYESEIDRLRGGDFLYSAPFGPNQEDLIQASYDEHSDTALDCSGSSFTFVLTGPNTDCTAGNLILLSRTYSLRAQYNVLPKLRVEFGNYFSDTTFVGSRDDPRATLVWTPQPNTAVRFAVGTAYVAPPSGFVAPIAGENKAVVNGTLEVSDALKPETSAGVDIGTDLGIHGDSKITFDVYKTALTNRFSTTTIEPAFTLGAGVPFGFYNGMPFSKISEVYNASDANEEGIELGYLRAPRVGFGVHADFDLLRAYEYNTVPLQLPGISVSSSQVDTIGGDGSETPGYQIPGYPYWHGRAEASYRFPSTARLAFGATFYGANNSFGEPGFTLFDFHSDLPITPAGVRLTASIENVFNHDDYRTLGEYAYGYLPPGETVPYSLFFAPPRRATLQLIYPFGGRP